MPTDADHVQANTFLFADLAGFTALTEAHGDDSATAIAGDFAAAVETILADYEAEEVKTIGDEVMIRTPDPATAVRLGLRIVDELAFHGSPPVRVGIHSGPAIRRDGDWFGSTVNLASRVADAAGPGEVLLTDRTRRELDEGNGFDLREGGARYFKHVPELVPVYVVSEPGRMDPGLEIDPVCRMAVAREQADSMRKRRGSRYYFCSVECRRRFDQDPRRYIALSPGARAARKGFLINLGAFATVGGAHLAVWAARGFAGASMGMLLLFAAWAAALLVHYRAVRALL
ncbi:MAG TPA: adenylate/guanylate cyclase domain-containing protein [Solirubrobacterales bacterium]|nr:adenylate/guanylate cyclase domain-containing protein [Solirubrobacterales bacterium]